MREDLGLLPNTVAGDPAIYAARELFRQALEESWRKSEFIGRPDVARELAVAQLAGREGETFVAF